MAERRYTIQVASPRAVTTASIAHAGALNDEQRVVVTAPEGPALVLAGAGSGKTRTLVYRLAYLVEQGIPPGAILLMTFTNRAAREMMKRAAELTRFDSRRMVGGTFHHVANVVLREHARLVGFGSNFTILDREDSRDLLETVASEQHRDVGERRFPKGDVLAGIYGYCLNTQSRIEEALVRRWPQFSQLAEPLTEIARRYDERKREMNLMDFDDLLAHWKTLLLEQAEVRAELGRRFRFLLVDEYQDTNLLQADIVDLMAEGHRNVLAVGDDAQSIYSFRGASFENVVSFPDRYAGASIYKLTANYRSTPEILTLANRSIAKARRGFPKELRAVRGSGARPAVVACRDVYEQAEFVAQRILELRDEGIPLEEIGVLYRAHHHSLELQLELTRRNVPYIVRSGLRFFEQAHIKDVLAYLRIVHNPHDELAWKRVLRLASGVGSVTAEKTWLLVKARSNPIDALGDEAVLAQLPRRAAAALESLHDTLSALVEIGRDHPSEMVESVLRNGYERLLVATYDNADARIDDVRQLAAYALSFHGLEEFLSELSLLASFTAENVVQGAEPDEHVTLSSVHQAKGLEWRAVFVVWLCDGRFPSMPALRDPDGEDEERRLFYVACTRAKDELYLTFPLVHQPFERERVLVARSRFIDELGAHELPYDRWTLEPSPVLPTLPGAPSPAQLPEARGRNDDDVFE
jgi:DNA helicase-2/ATP-dependent DNA helicase PcrA